MMFHSPTGRDEWRAPFADRVRPSLERNARILDVGAGRAPTIPIDIRPPGCLYVGLDVSRHELDKAPVGAYDEIITADITSTSPDWGGGYDLIVSWQVLEHVRPLSIGLENLRSSLRHGGRLVAMLSGRFAVFAVCNRLLPRRLAAWGMERLLGRDPETVFRAFYDRCYYSALEGLLSPWSHAELIPLYDAADYFRFSHPLQSAYCRYERWAERQGYANLATHYLLTARR